MHKQWLGHCWEHCCLFVCLFLNGHIHGIGKFPGQGQNPSCICDLHHSSRQYHCTGLGIELAPPQ